MADKEDFVGKYLTSNFLIRLLLRNFFKCVERIIYDIDFKSVLEVGCGAGFSTQYLKKIFQGKNFEASEYEEELIKEAQARNPDLPIRQESIYRLKREPDSFDLTVVLEVLEHLKDPDSALKELSRVSSKYCLVSVPQEPLWRILNICRLKYLSDFGNTPGHLNHWSKNQFIEFVGKYFKVKKIKLSLTWIIVLAEKRN